MVCSVVYLEYAVYVVRVYSIMCSVKCTVNSPHWFQDRSVRGDPNSSTDQNCRFVLEYVLGTNIHRISYSEYMAQNSP